MTLFSTVEAEAWSRGFLYEDYVSLCERTASTPVVCEEVYALLCQAFDKQFEEDMRSAVDTEEDVCEDVGVD